MRVGTGWAFGEPTTISTVRCPVCLAARVVQADAGNPGRHLCCSDAHWERWCDHLRGRFGGLGAGFFTLEVPEVYIRHYYDTFLGRKGRNAP